MKIKVFSFNLRVEAKVDGINYFDNRKERILEAIKEHSPDVIGFQEVNDRMRLWLRDSLEDYILIGCGRNADLSGEACVVAYKKDSFALLNYETFWLSATPDAAGTRYGEDQSSCPRVATALSLKHIEAKTPFLFINTHLDHKGSVARLLGSVQLLQYISERKMPTILTGDFNATPDSREIRVITENEVCGISDLTAMLGGTFHGFGKYTPDEMPKIDYIFSNMKSDPTESFAVIDASVEGLYISDHYIVCSFVEVE